MTGSAPLDGNSVLLFTDYFPPNGGGVEVVVERLAESLADAGAAVTIVAIRSGGSPERTYDSIDVRYIDGYDLTGIFGVQARFSAGFPLALRRIVADVNPELVHVHNRFFFTSATTALYFWISTTLRDVPFVSTLHLGEIGDLDGVGGTVGRLYDATVARAIVGVSDRIIVVSESVGEAVLSPSDPPHEVVPNATDPDEFRPGRSDDATTILFVGRLVENKGPQDLLSVVPDIVDADDDVRFRFVGTGPMADDLAVRARDLGVSGSVAFPGHVDSVAEEMARADVFCRPSYSEGMPLTLLEAMASGLPVVVSDVAGTGDVVEHGETGLLVEPGDSDALSRQISRLVLNPDLIKSVGDRAREVVVGEYTWDRRGERMIDIYAELISRN
jgi:glycosyltransferase involved in cell wall biosynthesis